jgi:Ca2+-binding RTX toxin-like protein
MANVTLTGGASGEVTFGVASAAAQDALNTLASLAATNSGTFGDSGYVTVTGGADTLTLTGPDTIYLKEGSTRIEASGSTDGITLIGGVNRVDLLSGTVSDKVSVKGGTNSIDIAAGSDTVTVVGGTNNFRADVTGNFNISDGFNTISFLAGDNLTVTGGVNSFTFAAASSETIGGGTNSIKGEAAQSITLNGGTNTLTLSGNDTITLNGGNDTIVDSGTATLSGSGNFYFRETGATGVNVAAGSGNATLIGGSGDDTFFGGSGPVSISGGAGSNIFNAGFGNETLNGAGSSTNTFNFTVGGSAATYDVTSFVAGDTIHIAGYTSTEVLAASTFTGGNTIISLNGGLVKIELMGFHLTSSNGHITGP